jgi:hypothetical protein
MAKIFRLEKTPVEKTEKEIEILKKKGWFFFFNFQKRTSGSSQKRLSPCGLWRIHNRRGTRVK